MSAGLDALAATTLGLTRRGRRRAAPPPGFARFVLDPAALDTLEPSSVAADDQPYDEHPGASEIRPQSLLFTGCLKAGPAGPPLICRPLFPGRLIFVGGAQASHPAPDEVSRAAYAAWDTEGTLMADLLGADRRPVNPDVLTRWTALMAVLGEAAPTRMWYGPVRIPAEFLFDAIPLLAPEQAPPPAADGQLSQGHREQISAFLAGQWGPVIGPPARSRGDADDQASADWMPQFVVAGGNVAIRVTAARRVTPFDGLEGDLVAASGVDVASEHPAYPANATVPARLVYQTVAAAGGLADPLPAACGPASRTYCRLRITRIWMPEPDCSVHFAAQAVRLSQDDGTLVAGQRLASHGLLFHGIPPGGAGPPPLNLTLTDLSADSSHELRWLAGGPETAGAVTRQCWQRAGGTSPLPVDLAAAGGAHAVARRPMRLSMLDEDTAPCPSPGGMRCTYLSMRRSVRALADNRIAGGRLSHETYITTSATRRLINEAMRPYGGFFTHTLRAFRDARKIPAGRRLRPADLLANGSPAPSEDLERAAWFLPFWQAFFPDTMPAQTVHGTRRRVERMTRGKVAYAIWQSQSELFSDPGLATNFPDALIGRGAPGALVLTGLAAGFFLDPPIVEGRELTDAEEDDMVARIVDRTLTQCALLQYWYTLGGYNAVRTRQHARHPGHSPVFLRVEPDRGDPAGIWVIDQGGVRFKPIAGPVGQRTMSPATVWIAAEWAE